MHHLNTALGDTAGAIIRAREALLITRLLVGAARLGRTSGALRDHVALVDGVLVISLCACVRGYSVVSTLRLVRTELCVRVGDVAVNGVFNGLVVGLHWDLGLAGTALVLVVLELAGGDVLVAHDC